MSSKNGHTERYITISASDGPLQYLAAVKTGPKDPQGASGLVGLSSTPYTWVLDTSRDRISTIDGTATWDFYDPPQDGANVYLYHRVTLSSNQEFDVTIGTGVRTLGHNFCIRNNMFVFCNGTFSTQWTVALAPTLDKSPLWSGSEKVTIMGENSIPVQMSGNASPGGMFQSPVFFSKSALLSKKQSKAQPVLLVNLLDWKNIKKPNVTHEGAFGQDFDKWSIKKVNAAYQAGEYDLRGLSWVVVWKFPGDLNGLDGYHTVYQTPLPVGNYPFWEDEWADLSPKYKLDAQLPAAPYDAEVFEMVEKFRQDFREGESVHHLENENGKQVAMIGTNCMIRNLWNVTTEEKKQVVEFLKDLLAIAKVYAFPCYTQHHAIVFYLDDATGERITPHKMVDLLTQSERGPVLRSVLQEYFGRQAANNWIRAYVSVYTKTTILPMHIISYNLAKNNIEKNVRRIANHVVRTKPDVLCLQEVTSVWLTIFVKFLQDSYTYAVGKFVDQNHDVALFVRKDNANINFNVYPLVKHDRRSVIIARGVLNERRIAITTAHMQSDFFSERATKIKATQLKQIAGILNSDTADFECEKYACFKLHAGDTNFTGYNLLALENEAITESGFVDMWPIVTPGFDARELQDNITFQQRDTTWSSPENKTIFQLQKISYEHHRPDRFLIHTNSSKCNAESSVMSIIRRDWSDHFGLELWMN
jgi:endonuclease/exonuclease/phosphatase family metal-dependent hydrolase